MVSAFVGVVEWWIKNNMPHAPQFMAQQVWNIFEKKPISQSANVRVQTAVMNCTASQSLYNPATKWWSSENGLFQPENTP
jgi:hypothetical protein